MESVFEFIQANIAYAPYLVFGLLLLAGFNLPVSEDALIFLCAILASKNPDYLYPLFFSVYMGAFFSDLICFFLGRYLGPKLWKIPLFAKMVSEEKVVTIGKFYSQYGVITLILGRFIPFGVRNGLFLTAGLGNMQPLKFALSDLAACTVSVSFFFTLYYKFGESVIEYVKKGNIVLFCTAIVVVTGIWWVKKKGSSQGQN